MPSRLFHPFRILAVLIVLGLGALVAGPAIGQTAQAQTETDAALARLIEVLRDDEARQRLIAELERAADTAEAGNGAAPQSVIELRSVGGQIADFTQWAAESTGRSLSELGRQILAAPTIFSALSVQDLRLVGTLAVDLLALVVITYGGYYGLRYLTGNFRRRIKGTVGEDSVLGKLIVLAITLVLDLGAAVLPWALGYIVALSVLGDPGDISFAHSLYLNAFVLIEVALAFLRFLVSPYRAQARLIRLEDAHALAVIRWGRLLTSVFVFSQMLILPLFSRMISTGAGRAIGVIGLLMVLGFAVAAVLKANRPVSRRLARRAGVGRNRNTLRFIARYWHMPVLAYLAGLGVLAITRPLGDFYSILVANGQIAIAVVIGIVVSNLLGKMIGRGIVLPPELSRRVPLLERRLNTFVPRALSALRFAIFAAVVVFCLHTLGVIDFFALLESQVGGRMANAIVTIALILIVTFVAWLVLNSWVDYRINPELAVIVSARERTLLVLLRNALTITLLVVSLMIVLSELGLNIAPLLASAGVIGLAIGFGAQKLVQDIITGIFIQLEGAIDVGDVVSIGGISGVVERLTIRSAALRDVEGSYHIIPFSSVDTVTNFMRGFSFALIDMGVAYRENTEEAKAAMFDAFAELRANPDFKSQIIAEFEWMGVNAFGPSEVVLRARIKTLPGKQWGIRRAYSAIVKRIFDERNIEIPFPHQTVYFGTDKRGKAPPIHLAREDNGEPEPRKRPRKSTPSEAKPARRRRRKPDVDLPDVDAGPER
ncbi:mechanosensitive ion channel domain-containing protein [Pelagibacterium limicola]|uniref:mechanosensitive ion channel domain-containing protein n=1 Tax=Pelagibacterium limicola TaxID=2791022 RepID=UPI0018B00079|nr:mechanosensitive ion channel domain-containing protein [Pelagibacterium limicola]